MEELATSHMDFSMSQCDQCEDLKQRIKQLEAENKRWENANKIQNENFKKLNMAWNQHRMIIEQENTRLKEAIEFVDNWCKAYPIEIFPEPDMKKAHEILKKHGMTLDAIGASNMRHVINGVREELKKALEE